MIFSDFIYIFVTSIVDSTTWIFATFRYVLYNNFDNYQ